MRDQQLIQRHREQLGRYQWNHVLTLPFFKGTYSSIPSFFKHQTIRFQKSLEKIFNITIGSLNYLVLSRANLIHCHGALYIKEGNFILDENDERLKVEFKKWEGSFGGEPKFEQMKTRTAVVNYVASPHHLLNVVDTEVFDYGYQELLESSVS